MLKPEETSAGLSAAASKHLVILRILGGCGLLQSAAFITIICGFLAVDQMDLKCFLLSEECKP